MNSDDIRKSMDRTLVQSARERSEIMRWLLLVTLNVARPTECPLYMMLSVIRAEYRDATQLEIRRELDYLQSRDLIALHEDHMGNVAAKIMRHGIDVHNYTVPCEPGIARPSIGA